MEAAAAKLADKIVKVFIDPIVLLLVGASIILFFWGLAKFIGGAEGNEKEKGKDHMIWGVVGMLVVFSAWGILNLIIETISSVK